MMGRDLVRLHKAQEVQNKSLASDNLRSELWYVHYNTLPGLWSLPCPVTSLLPCTEEWLPLSWFSLWAGSSFLPYPQISSMCTGQYHAFCVSLLVCYCPQASSFLLYGISIIPAPMSPFSHVLASTVLVPLSFGRLYLLLSYVAFQALVPVAWTLNLNPNLQTESLTFKFRSHTWLPAYWPITHDDSNNHPWTHLSWLVCLCLSPVVCTYSSWMSFYKLHNNGILPLGCFYSFFYSMLYLVIFDFLL